MDKADEQSKTAARPPVGPKPASPSQISYAKSLIEQGTRGLRGVPAWLSPEDAPTDKQLAEMDGNAISTLIDSLKSRKPFEVERYGGGGYKVVRKASPERVADRHLSTVQASTVRTSALRNSSVLSSEQKNYIKEMLNEINGEMRTNKVFEGLPTALSGDVRDDWQSGAKEYKKDGFGRMSPLAGKPHALVKITFSVLAPDGDRYLANTDLEMLLSQDGTTAILKNDQYGMRGVKTADPVKLGQEVAKSLAHGVTKGKMLARQQEEAKAQAKAQAEVARREQAERDRLEREALAEKARAAEEIRQKAIQQLKRNFKSLDKKIKTAIGSLPESDRPRFFGATILTGPSDATVACKVYVGNDPNDGTGTTVRWNQNRQIVEFLRDGQATASISDLADAPKNLEHLADKSVSRWLGKLEQIKQEAADRARQEAERNSLSGVKSRLRSIKLGPAGRARSVEQVSPTEWEIEPSNRQRLDHYVGSGYDPGEDDDPEGWDSDGWEDEYAGPIRSVASSWLDAEFGAGLFDVDVGEKGHVEIFLTSQGQARFTAKTSAWVPSGQSQASLIADRYLKQTD